VLVEEYLPAIVAEYLHIARSNGYLPRDIWGLSFIYRLARLLGVPTALFFTWLRLP